MGPKVLLVASPCRTKNSFWTCSITSPVGSLMPPCDLASIAGTLRAQGAEPRILDLRLFDRPLDALRSEIDRWQPDALVAGMATATAMDDYQVLRAAVGRVERRVAFNFHAMALPEDVFAEGATHILAGDPEYGVGEAVGCRMGNGRGVWTPDAPRSAPGWIEPLDDLPYPANDLIDVKVYHTLTMGREPFSILLANRGCPYGCGYCVIPFLFGRKARTPSVDRTVGEIERDLKEFGIRSFFFIDSALNLKPRWLAELCEELLRKSLRVRWCGNMRASPVSRDLLSLMKRAGCFRVFYGVEDLDLIEELDRKTTREATVEAFRLTREAGIESVAFLILFPGFDRSEEAMVGRMLSMVRELKPSALQCNLAVPYPGSGLFDEYRCRFDMGRDWSLYDPAGNELPYPTELDLVKVRRMVYLRFFLGNPAYVLSVLKQTDLRSLLDFARGGSRVLLGRRS